MSKRDKLSIGLVIFGLILYPVQNFYFGWNREAQSILEHVVDWIVIATVLAGFIIKPSSTTIKQSNIKTKTVNVYQPEQVVSVNELKKRDK